MSMVVVLIISIGLFQQIDASNHKNNSYRILRDPRGHSNTTFFPIFLRQVFQKLHIWPYGKLVEAFNAVVVQRIQYDVQKWDSLDAMSERGERDESTVEISSDWIIPHLCSSDKKATKVLVKII